MLLAVVSLCVEGRREGGCGRHAVPHQRKDAHRIALEGPGQKRASCASVIPSLPGTTSNIEHRGLHRRSLAAVGLFFLSRLVSSRVCVFCRSSWSGSPARRLGRFCSVSASSRLRHRQANGETRDKRHPTQPVCASDNTGCCWLRG